jgi:hypothetical protein
MKTLSVVAILVTCFLLCGFQQGASPGQRKPAPQAAADKQKTDSGKTTRGAAPPVQPAPDATDENATGAASTIDRTGAVPGQGVEPPMNKAKADRSGEDIEIQRQLAKYTQNLVWVGIGQAVVLALTLVVIGLQAKLMRTHADHLKSLASAAQSNTIAAAGQLKAMQEQIEQMQESGRQTDKIIEAAQRSADAAKISADIAASVSVPTLVVDDFDLGNPPGGSLEAMLQFPTAKLVVKNYGQTPAFLRSWSVIFTCGDLPEVPDYSSHPGSGIVLDKVVIQPNHSYTFPPLSGWQRQEFSLDDVQAIMDKRKILNVYGCVNYWDIFSNPIRRLKFCETAINLFAGSSPRIMWFSQLAPAVYSGTDLMPIKNASGGEIENQTASADTQADDEPEQAD